MATEERLVTITMDIEDWQTIQLGLKDLADKLSNEAVEYAPHIREDMEALALRNRRLAAALEALMLKGL